MPSTRPTIFALSSGRGPAAIAVVRISGPRAGALRRENAGNGAAAVATVDSEIGVRCEQDWLRQ